MKALSILQPWASLIVLGHKRIETRSWNTKYRGPLLIHASAKYTNHQDWLATEWHVMLDDSQVYHNHRGAIIGMVNVVDTGRTDILIPDNKVEILGDGQYDYIHLTKQEEAFGDYSPGRYGWLLSEPLLFPEPIPCKGALGIWNVPENLTAEAETQIRKAKTLIV